MIEGYLLAGGLVVTQLLMGWRGALLRTLLMFLTVLWYQGIGRREYRRRSMIWVIVLVFLVPGTMSIGHAQRRERLTGQSMEYAESVADFVQEKVKQLADVRGLCISQRFSPGYCDWSIDQQAMVFRTLNIGTGEIRLTEKCLMLPRKSISGIIGIGPCSNVGDYNPCKACEKTIIARGEGRV